MSFAANIFEWVGNRSGVFLAGILVIVAGTLGFVKLADEVREGETGRFDNRINRFCYEHRGPSWLQEAGRDVTAIGGVTVLMLVVASVAGYLLIAGERGMMVWVIVATVGGLLVSSGLKHWIDRPRPAFRPLEIIVYTTSFPSGHSALSAATYLTLGTLLTRTTKSRALKFYFLITATLATFLVGVSRVYLCAHFPTDVLAGWCVGLVWALICWVVTLELQYRRVIEPERQPGLLKSED